MKKILISWIGRTDLRAVTEVGIVGLGPIAQAVRDISFDRVVLLNNFPEVAVKPYLRWLNGIKSVVVSTNKAALTSPTNFAESGSLQFSSN